MIKLIEFDLEDGQKIYIEDTTQSNSKSGFQMAAEKSEKVIEKASMTFEKTVEKIKPAAIAVANAFKTISPDELEIGFGLKLTAAAGVVFSSISSDVTFEVKMTWKAKQ